VVRKEQSRIFQENHNPLTSPELRPIERYWAILKRNVKKRSLTTFNIKSFKKKLDEPIKSIDMKVVQSLMSGFEGKVRKFRHGEEI
jgi:hypothetical protein